MDVNVEYVSSDGTNIAYSCIGEGERDLLLVLPGASNFDVLMEYPAVERGVETVSGMGRLIIFDRRGAGLSDRLCGPGTLEEGMDDALAVLDAAGAEKAAVFGVHEAGCLAMLFAATHPERASALVLYGAFASTTWHEDYPWGQKPEERQLEVDFVAETWGRKVGTGAIANPAASNDESFLHWWAKWQRNGLSKDAVRPFFDIAARTDVRSILPAIQVPTLILHRRESLAVPIENAYYLNEHIPGSKLVELHGEDFMPFLGDSQAIVDEVEEFLTGTRRPRDTDRILATLLFVDVVDSTSAAGAVGDRQWKEILDRLDALVGKQVEWHGGRVVKNLGDGYMAAFDRPAQAVRCAQQIKEEASRNHIALRLGVHTGEVEVRGDDLGGIAVHITARVMEAAGPDELLVSGAVPPLIAGSGIAFVDRGPHDLRGVEGFWSLFEVVE